MNLFSSRRVIILRVSNTPSQRCAVALKVGTCTSELLGEGQAEKAELPHLADDVVAELALAVELFGGGR